MFQTSVATGNSPGRENPHTPSRFREIRLETENRSVLVGRVRQVVRFATDALTELARTNPLDRVVLGVVEAALVDALEAIRSIKAGDTDRAF